MIEEISEHEFPSVEQRPLVVVDFFAEWCMPCVVQEPIVEELSKKFQGKIHFAKINVDESNKLAQKFRVMSIPTLLVLKKGKEVDRIIGIQNPEILEEKISRFL